MDPENVFLDSLRPVGWVCGVGALLLAGWTRWLGKERGARVKPRDSGVMRVVPPPEIVFVNPRDLGDDRTVMIVPPPEIVFVS